MKTFRFADSQVFATLKQAELGRYVVNAIQEDIQP